MSGKKEYQLNTSTVYIVITCAVNIAIKLDIMCIKHVACMCKLSKIQK